VDASSILIFWIADKEHREYWNFKKKEIQDLNGGGEMESPVDGVVEEIMGIHRSLPTRPGIDEVEAAKALIKNVEKEDQARLDAIARHTKNPDVPEELFMVLQEMRKNLVFFQSKEQKREALRLLDLDNLHSLFDEFIQRASKCLPSTTSGSGRRFSNEPKFPAPTSTSTSTSTSYYSEKEPVKTSELFTRDDSYVTKAKSTFYADGLGIGIGIGIGPGVSSTARILDPSLKPPTTSSGKSSLHFDLVPLLFHFLTCYPTTTVTLFL
jgi:hypothetical protein